MRVTQTGSLHIQNPSVATSRPLPCPSKHPRQTAAHGSSPRQSNTLANRHVQSVPRNLPCPARPAPSRCRFVSPLPPPATSWAPRSGAGSITWRPVARPSHAPLRAIALPANPLRPRLLLRPPLFPRFVWSPFDPAGVRCGRPEQRSGTAPGQRPGGPHGCLFPPVRPSGASPRRIGSAVGDRGRLLTAHAPGTDIVPTAVGRSRGCSTCVSAPIQLACRRCPPG